MKIKSLLFAIAIVAMTSCGSSRKAVADVEINVPCSGLEFVTSAEYFRASAMGTSTSLEIASQKAMTAARAKLAAAIETTVKSVTDNYLSSYEDGEVESARSRFQTIQREVVNQKLNGIRVICQKTMKGADNQYKCYVAIELAGSEIANGINEEVQKGVSDDSKLRTDFEYQKFLETFEAEMSNLADQQ